MQRNLRLREKDTLAEQQCVECGYKKIDIYRAGIERCLAEIELGKAHERGEI